MSSVSVPVPVERPSVALLWALALAGVVFLVSFEQGMLTAGSPVAHELFHDARHLLGFPCH